MPQLRKGRIVHYIHGADDPYPGAVEPAIVVRVHDGQAALTVFGEHGAVYRDGVRVVGGSGEAQRGQAFWPDYDAKADVDFVQVQAAAVTAEPDQPDEPVINVPEAGGEVPMPSVPEPPEPPEPMLNEPFVGGNIDKIGI